MEADKVIERRICVIGSGCSGLTSIKHCLEQGLKPFCFEQSNAIGGNWNFREHEPCVLPGTVNYESKDRMCFSDFPAPDSAPNFMDHNLMQQYLLDYANHFQLVQHIQFQTAVTKIEQPITENGKWSVHLTNKNSESRIEQFDGVMICAGRPLSRNTPAISGRESFKVANVVPSVQPLKKRSSKGTELHLVDVKSYNQFKGLRVLIVGQGQSSIHLATSIAHSARKVLVSSERGLWLMPLVGPYGRPHDFTQSRYRRFMCGLSPWDWNEQFHQHLLCKRCDHTMYSIQPRHPVTKGPVVHNDTIHNLLIAGLVIVKEGVASLSRKGARFDDGSEEDVDVIVYSSEWSRQLPFLHQIMGATQSRPSSLQKGISSLEHPSLAYIGYPLCSGGPLLPLVEMQARWAVTNMGKSIKSFNEKKEPTGDYIAYMNQLAQSLRIQPNIIYPLNPKLTKELIFGPTLPFEYRLRGQGNCAQLAQKWIMRAKPRLWLPASSGPFYQIKNSQSFIRQKIPDFMLHYDFLWIFVFVTFCWLGYLSVQVFVAGSNGMLPAGLFLIFITWLAAILLAYQYDFALLF